MKYKWGRLSLIFCILVVLSHLWIPVDCFASGGVSAQAQYEILAGESRTVGESMALAIAMQDAVEQIETLVDAESKEMGGALSKDVVYAVSSGIIKVDDKKVEWLNDKIVRVTIHASMKEQDINAYRQKYFSDDKTILKYKKMQDEYSSLFNENKRLNNELMSAKDNNEKVLINEKIKDKNQHYLGAIWFERAYSQHIAGQDDEAFISLDTSLSFVPDYSNAYGLYGSIYYDEGKLDLALQSYQKALQISPNNTEVIYNEGLIYKTKKDLVMAMQCFNKALELDPYLGPAYNVRASIYSLYNQPRKAIIDYQTALKINYLDYDALVGMSMSLRELQQYSSAINYADKAITVNPKIADGYMAKAMSLALIGKLTESLANLDRAIQYAKDDELRRNLIQVRNVLQEEIEKKLNKRQ